MKTRKVTLKVLRDREEELMLPDTGDPALLFCDHCGGENSANPADYWDGKDSLVFMCCDQPMRLVFRRTMYVDALP